MKKKDSTIKAFIIAFAMLILTGCNDNSLKNMVPRCQMDSLLSIEYDQNARSRWPIIDEP